MLARQAHGAHLALPELVLATVCVPLCRRNNTFTGFPAMGLRYQRMESATLRAAYQMGSEVKGVLVRELSPTAPVAQVLKADDVITHFDGVQVSSDGTVPFR